MNKLILDQATRALNDGRMKAQNYYLDVAMAEGVLEYVVKKLESYLCENAENGKCELWWRHEDCLRIMEILYEFTEDRKYLHFRDNKDLDFEN